MNKIVASPEQAVADIPDGATVAIAGFGVAHRFATALICALRNQKTRDLTLVCNSLGDGGATRGQILAENNQVKKLIAAFSVGPGTPTASEEQIGNGKMGVELVPPGIEVDEIVEPDGIPPALIDLPGIFVARVVKPTHIVDGKAWRRPARRPADQPRLYDGKPALTRQGIAKNAAKLVREGTYVNLGVGIPTMVSNYLEGRDVILHAEDGVLGFGRRVAQEHEIA